MYILLDKINLRFQNSTQEIYISLSAEDFIVNAFLRLCSPQVSINVYLERSTNNTSITLYRDLKTF